MTREEALTCTEYHTNLCNFEVGPRGGVKEHHVTWRQGKVRVWKRDPLRFRISIHRGLYSHDVLDAEYQLQWLHTPEQCPAAIASRNYYLQLEEANQGVEPDHKSHYVSHIS